MNLPNQITIGRLVLSAILFVVLDVLCRGTYGWVWYGAFTLYMVTVLSDGLDGYLARSRGQITVFGRIADPLHKRSAKHPPAARDQYPLHVLPRCIC